MKPIREIRRERLAALVAKHGGQSAFAAAMGKDKNQVYQWLQPSESKAARNISDASARVLEETFGLPEGWMDQPLSSESSVEPSHDVSVVPTQQASESLRLDPAKLESAVRFLEQQFAVWGRDFDAAARAPLIARVYDYLTSETPKNLVSLSQWLASKLSEEDSNVGAGKVVASDGVDRKRAAGGTGQA